MKRILLYIAAVIFIIALALPSFAEPEKVLKGSIEKFDYKNNILTVLDYSGKIHYVNVTASTTVEIEGEYFNIEDLYYGQEVDIFLIGNKAERIIAYAETDPERYGYIIPGSRFVTGEVLFLKEDSIEIKNEGKKEKYRITSSTKIIKGGEPVSVIRIKEGDKVLLTFNDIYSSEVDTIRVQDSEEAITGLMRGKIRLVDERKEEIHIYSPYIYKEGNTWMPYGEYMVKLKITDNNLYNGGRRIKLSDLAEYKDREVYIAYSSKYGRLNVSKLQVKSGSLRVYESFIDDIEYGSGRMIVDKSIIHFNEGTIVVKDNKLVDVLNMEGNKKVKINAEYKNGMLYASIVAIEGSSILDKRLDDTKIAIYRGKISNIHDYEIEIGKLINKTNYMKLTEDGIWREEKDSARFSVTEDTLIYDSQLKEEIPVNSLLNTRYFDLNSIKNSALRNRLQNKFYKDKTAYFIVRESSFGKELLALNITPHISSYVSGLGNGYLTMGKIEDINYDEYKMALADVKNYNTLNRRWEYTLDETLDISQAVILYNDVPIPLSRIYTLRKGLTAYVVKYKQTSRDVGYVILIED